MTGWIGFGISDLLIGTAIWVDNLRHLLVWWSSMMIGFVLTFGLRIYYRHFLNKGAGILKVIILIISGSLVAGFLWHVVGSLMTNIAFPAHYEPGYKPVSFLTRIYNLSWPMIVWSVLYFGLKFWINMFVEKIRAGRADAESRKAQLELLRYQINPHFLFNTLNSIRALIRRDAASAEMMITEFSELFRYSLKHNNKAYIALKDEIEFVRKYLLLEKIRFNHRLDYRFENTPDSLEMPVLYFLLQPFVENAIKHGMKNSPSGIIVTLRSYLTDSILHLEIENTGGWIPDTQESGTGIKNVAERLATAYPGNHTLGIDKGDVLVKVSVTINFKNENIQIPDY